MKLKTVLLIDDDQEEHQFFSEALAKYNRNITCITAYNCTQGYTYAEQKKPDIIFLDMNLPGTNGIACLRKIKKTSSLVDVPVYMYSGGSVSERDIVTALHAGAVKWIRKPNDLNDYTMIFSNCIA
jgi:DNA-binding response OmpR family regulator